MRTRRPLLAGISIAVTLLVFLLFSFPYYCDNCAYRNITLYAYSMAPDRAASGSPRHVPPDENPAALPNCCAGTGQEYPDGKDGADSHGAATLRHVRVPYCLSYTISSIAGPPSRTRSRARTTRLPSGTASRPGRTRGEPKALAI